MNLDKNFSIALNIIESLMNENCFDFWEIKDADENEIIEYFKDMIFTYFSDGEVDLAGVIHRVDSGNEDISGRASVETVENINNFFKNEDLVNCLILLSNEVGYWYYKNYIMNNDISDCDENKGYTD